MGHTAISGTAEPSQPSFNKGRRIQAIDALRGFALLGILIMNIPHFAGPFVLHNPTAYGNFAGMEQWIWNLSHILADQKFMTIFSPLYGAGILLLTSRQNGGVAPPRRFSLPVQSGYCSSGWCITSSFGMATS